MSKLLTLSQAIADHVPDGSNVALGLQMEQMIPFAAGHEIMRQKKRDLRLTVGPLPLALKRPPSGWRYASSIQHCHRDA